MEPIHVLLQKRFSPRAFEDRSVAKETIRSFLEAARWAPSSFNEQPWRFLVATKDDPAEHEKLLRCLAPGNQKWAETAPVLIHRKHPLSSTTQKVGCTSETVHKWVRQAEREFPPHSRSNTDLLW